MNAAEILKFQALERKVDVLTEALAKELTRASRLQYSVNQLGKKLEELGIDPNSILAKEHEGLG